MEDELLSSGEITSEIIQIDSKTKIIDEPEPQYIQFIDYWKGLLNFGYYTLIIPFRLKKSNETRKLEIYSCKLQQVLCAIVQGILLFDFISLFWASYWEASADNNIGYFQSLTYIGYVAYHLCLNFTFWFQRTIFCSVFHQLQSLKFYAETSRARTALFIKIISFGFCVAILIMALTESSLVNNFYMHGSLEKYYNYLSKKAQLHFLFIKPEEIITSKNFCFLPMIVTVIRIAILIPSLILVPFLDVFVLLIPFSIWRMMCAFEKFYKNTAGSPFSSEKILQKYWMIKKLLQDLNRAIGLLLCCCVSVSLPYYATWSAVTYFKDNVHPVTLFHVYGFFSVFFLALTLAADINKKGAEFFSWISSPNNCKEIEPKTLTSLLVDLHSNQIALKGNGFFQISYRFLGTIFGVIVTYSIITIQIQLSRKVFDIEQCNCSTSSP